MLSARCRDVPKVRPPIPKSIDYFICATYHLILNTYLQIYTKKMRVKKICIMIKLFGTS